MHGASLLRRLAVVAALALSAPAYAGVPGKDGAALVTAANTTVNCYTTLAANAAAGATSVTVTSAAALTCGTLGTLGVGDLILIVQIAGCHHQYH